MFLQFWCWVAISWEQYHLEHSDVGSRESLRACKAFFSTSAVCVCVRFIEAEGAFGEVALGWGQSSKPLLSHELWGAKRVTAKLTRGAGDITRNKCAPGWLFASLCFSLCYRAEVQLPLCSLCPTHSPESKPNGELRGKPLFGNRQCRTWNDGVHGWSL